MARPFWQRILGTSLAVAAEDEFVGAEFVDAHGAASVEAVGADANFGAEAELRPVGVTCRGVMVNAGTVDAA